MKIGEIGIYLILVSLMTNGLIANGMWQGPLWDTSRSLPTPQGLSGMIAGVSNDVLIVAGGCNFSKPIPAGGEKRFYDEIYIAIDPERLDWQYVGKLAKATANAAVIQIADGLLVIGGMNGESLLDDVFFICWDEAKRCIRVDDSFPPLPYPMESLSATRLGDAVYVAGGRAVGGNAQRNFWKLDSSGARGVPDRQWESLPAWPGPCRAGAALLSYVKDGKGCIYLVGGKGKGYLNDMYCYEPLEMTWRPLAVIPRPAYYSGAIVGSGPYLLLFSGSDGHDAARAIEMGDDYHMPKDTYCYLTVEDRWISVGNLPLGVAGAGITRWGGKLIVIGGELRPGVRTSTVQITCMADLETEIQNKIKMIG